MPESKETIAILGCGWLGLPLAQHFISKKYKVNGSTTTESKLELLKTSGIHPFLIDLTNRKNIPKNFFEMESLVINIPPGLRRGNLDQHLKELGNAFEVINQSEPLKNILFVSSTSVYPDSNQTLTEENPDENSQIFIIEEEVKKLWRKNLTILRCGGLMGYGRIPCKYYSGKKNLELADTPVNYIFRDDVIGIIDQVLQKKAWNKTFNAVAPQHPKRIEIIRDCTERTDYLMPEFAKKPTVKPFKIISSEKVLRELEYKFLYPNPLSFPY